MLHKCFCPFAFTAVVIIWGILLFFCWFGIWCPWDTWLFDWADGGPSLCFLCLDFFVFFFELVQLLSSSLAPLFNTPSLLCKHIVHTTNFILIGSLSTCKAARHTLKHLCKSQFAKKKKKQPKSWQKACSWILQHSAHFSLLTFTLH